MSELEKSLTNYDKLLEVGELLEKRVRASRKILKVRDQRKEESRQNYKTELITQRNGFQNLMLETFIGEIVPGGRTGMHRHLAEALIYILDGSGYSIVDEERVEWETGDALFIPTFVWHQHFNTGRVTAKYLAAVPGPLLRSVGLFKMEQKENKKF